MAKLKVFVISDIQSVSSTCFVLSPGESDVHLHTDIDDDDGSEKDRLVVFTRVMNDTNAIII